MKNGEKFLLGLVTGSGAALAGTRVVARTARILRGARRRHHRRLARAGAGDGAPAGRRRARACACWRATRRSSRARAKSSPARAGEVADIRCDIRRARRRPRRGRHGPRALAAIDVLINNAGVIQVGPLEHMTTRGLRERDGDPFLGAAAPDVRDRAVDAPPRVRPNRQHRVDRRPDRGPALAPYSASKFALVGLSDAVRAELEQYGIRVTTVDAGPDAHGIAGKRGHQREAPGRIRLVRDF